MEPGIVNSERRYFLGLAAWAVSSRARIGRGSANDRLRLGIVGMNNRGNALMKSLLRIRDENVEVVALCDVDSVVLNKRAGELETVCDKRPKTSGDMRTLLELAYSLMREP
jgi:hypothetical protein